jgi:hypothetical protein
MFCGVQDGFPDKRVEIGRPRHYTPTDCRTGHPHRLMAAWPVVLMAWLGRHLLPKIG